MCWLGYAKSLRYHGARENATLLKVAVVAALPSTDIPLVSTEVTVEAEEDKYHGLTYNCLC